MSENNKKYGEAWRAELMKWRKSEIIDFLKDTLVCNRIHQWHYPSKGDLPEDNRLILLCYKNGVAKLGYYDEVFVDWKNEYGDTVACPYAWQYIEPPKEMCKNAKQF